VLGGGHDGRDGHEVQNGRFGHDGRRPYLRSSSRWDIVRQYYNFFKLQQQQHDPQFHHQQPQRPRDNGDQSINQQHDFKNWAMKPLDKIELRDHHPVETTHNDLAHRPREDNKGRQPQNHLIASLRASAPVEASRVQNQMMPDSYPQGAKKTAGPRGQRLMR
jgi:hypothetical protein